MHAANAQYRQNSETARLKVIQDKAHIFCEAVRQATSEFKDFALIWWNELAKLDLQPHTWDRLK
ncbi:MAG: hypothetical protein P8Y47_01100, partial [Alphaproteobacteria bacterium]